MSKKLTISQKIFPYGALIFIISQFAAWLLDRIFDNITLTYLGYVLIVAYFIYLALLIHKDEYKTFSISQKLQWLFLFVIPLLSSMLSLSFLWAINPELTLISLLIKSENIYFITMTFFFMVLLIWGIMLIGKQLINRSNYFAYAVTCIPIKEGSTLDKMTVCLISNDSHNKSAWMFPGGHVNLTKSYLNEKNLVLSKIAEVPEKVITKKASSEAGLKNLNLLSFDSNFRVGMRRLKTSWSLRPPAFTYLFKVSEHANCHKVLQHHVHFDFTYIGTYSNIDKAVYKTHEFEFSPSSLPADKSKAISDISLKLSEELNKIMGNVTASDASHELYPDSIPDMIYSAYKYYEIYLKVNP